MSEYIPTEARICIDFCNAATKRAQADGSFMSMEDADAAFSRWLAAHDAEMRAENVTEPDYEYEVTYSSASAPSIDGYRMRRSSGILPSLAVVAEWLCFSQNPIAHRRTKAVPAGEWERIEIPQGGETDA